MAYLPDNIKYPLKKDESYYFMSPHKDESITDPFDYIKKAGYLNAVFETRRVFSHLQISTYIDDQHFKDTVKQEFITSIAQYACDKTLFTRIHHSISNDVEFRGKVVIMSLEEFANILKLR